MDEGEGRRGLRGMMRARRFVLRATIRITREALVGEDKKPRVPVVRQFGTEVVNRVSGIRFGFRFGMNMMQKGE